MAIDTATLAAQPFFKGMSADLLEILIQDAMPAQFAEGELIFGEGGVANRLYLLLSGKVALQLPNDLKDKVETIETIGPGCMLGWSWLFPPYYWHFDARVVSPVKAIFFYGTRVREQCEVNHELGYELMKRLSMVVIDRLQATRRRLADRDNALLTPL